MAEVRRLVGKPDEKWTAADPFPFGALDRESWGWGTNGHFSFPTMGAIEFEENNKVYGVTAPLHDGRSFVEYLDFADVHRKGGLGREYVKKIGDPFHSFEVHWNEVELKENLRKLDRLLYPEGKFSLARPGLLELIRAANILIPLGEAKGTAALCEYDQLCRGYHGNSFIYSLIRCLYIPKSIGGFLPTPGIGAYSPDRPTNQNQIPEFPILVQDDIPFDLTMGVFLAGVPASVASDIYEVRQVGHYRTRPLVPGNDPFGSLHKAIEFIKKTDMFTQGRSSHAVIPSSEIQLEDRLRRDLGQLIRTVVKPTQGVKAVPMKWDVSRQMYVRPDGTFLPLPNTAPAHPRVAFKLPELGTRFAWLTLERYDKGQISLELMWVPKGQLHPMTVDVLTGPRHEKRFATIRLPSAAAVDDSGYIEYRQKYSQPEMNVYSFQRPFSTSSTEITIQITVDGRKVLRTQNLPAEPKGMQYYSG